MLVDHIFKTVSSCSALLHVGGSYPRSCWLITDLGVLNSRMSFSRHIDIKVKKALAMLGFAKRLSGEFRDPYTLRNLYVSLVRPKLEYANYVRRLFL
jgi:hypothetical protein